MPEPPGPFLNQYLPIRTITGKNRTTALETTKRYKMRGTIDKKSQMISRIMAISGVSTWWQVFISPGKWNSLQTWFQIPSHLCGRREGLFQPGLAKSQYSVVPLCSPASLRSGISEVGRNIPFFNQAIKRNVDSAWRHRSFRPVLNLLLDSDPIGIVAKPHEGYENKLFKSSGIGYVHLINTIY